MLFMNCDNDNEIEVIEYFSPAEICLLPFGNNLQAKNQQGWF